MRFKLTRPRRPTLFLILLIPVVFAGCESELVSPLPDDSESPEVRSELASLSVSNGVLVPEFASEVKHYRVFLPSDLDRLAIAAAPMDSKGRVMIEGVQVPHDRAYALHVQEGSTIVEVTIGNSSSGDEPYTIQIDRGGEPGISFAMVGESGSPVVSVKSGEPIELNLVVSNDRDEAFVIGGGLGAEVRWNSQYTRVLGFTEPSGVPESYRLFRSAPGAEDVDDLMYADGVMRFASLDFDPDGAGLPSTDEGIVSLGRLTMVVEADPGEEIEFEFPILDVRSRNGSPIRIVAFSTRLLVVD